MSDIYQRPVIWTIAASDSCAGAGIQADIKMAHALDTECSCIVTALTAQSSYGVDAVESTSISMLEKQWQSLKKDGWPNAIKIGWLPAENNIIDWLKEKLREFKKEKNTWVIWDPVLSASQGGLPQANLVKLRTLLPMIDMITPNQKEALLLSDSNNLQSAAAYFKQQGVKYIVVSGGDTPQEKKVTSYCWGGDDHSQPEQQVLNQFLIQQPFIDESVHGTGCHFSSAVTAYLAKNERIYDAVLLASAAMSSVIEQSSKRVSSYHNAWAASADHVDYKFWPKILSTQQQDYSFKKLRQPLGLYALVDHMDWLKRLLELGVDTVQWRVKNPTGNNRRNAQEALGLCQEKGVNLYINDDWKLAIELQAFGVHLGQEDLNSADLKAIDNAGLALGVSTHTEWEIARTCAIEPSYIAFGPVHPPLSKKLKYPPLGYEKLQHWVERLHKQYPLTCIGGITHKNIQHVAETGIESAAIVTDLMVDDELEYRHSILRSVYPSSV